MSRNLLSMKMNLLIVILFLSSCGKDDFRRVESLNEFRVLGVVASSPEVAPGGSSNLQLIISDPTGGGRTIDGSYESCVDPGISLGASVSCDHDPDRVTGNISIDTTSIGAGNFYTGLSGSSLAINVPSDILDGRNAREKMNGVGYITIFRFDVDGKITELFKRVIATDRTTLNTNPIVSALNINGSPIGTEKPQKNDKMSVTTSSPETYSVMNIDGTSETRTETLEVGWYVTSGELDKPKAKVSETVEFQDDPPSNSIVILSLVRDERGGLGFLRTIK